MRNVLKIFSAFVSINAIRAIAPFLLLPILTRYLSASDYGILSIYDATILVLTPVVLFNATGLVGSRFYKRDRGYIESINSNTVVLVVLCCLVMEVVVIFFLLSNKLSKPMGGIFLLLLPIFVLFRALNTYISNLWQIQHKIKLFSIFSIGTLFADLGCSFVLVVLLAAGYQGRLIGSHLSFAFFTVLGLYLLKKEKFLSLTNNRERLLEIVRFGTPLIPHALGGVSLAVSGRYVLMHLASSYDVGLYSLAYQIGSIMLLLGTSVNQAWSVSLFKWLGDGVEKNRQAISKAMIAMVGILLLAAILIILGKNLVFWVLASRKYEAAKPLYPLMVIGFLFQSLYFLVVNFDFYEERVIAIGVTTFVVAVLSVVLCYVLVSRFGVMGAAYANLISMVSYFLIVLVRVAMYNKNFQRVWFKHG